MATVYPRGSVLYFDYLDADGRRVQRSSGLRIGDQKKAELALKILEQEIEAQKRAGQPAMTRPTVRSYGTAWCKERPGQGVVTAEDEKRSLELHVYPVIGDVLLDELRPHHCRDLARALKAKESAKGDLLAARTVRRIMGTVHTMLQEAVIDELIPANPCVLKRGEIPAKVDKDPNWRPTAKFTRAEVEQLISDPRIPEDRRVLYALEFLTGMRTGEAADRRWADYDAEAKPLGRLHVASSWNSHVRKSSSTKTERPRSVPVHPALTAVIKHWRESGWERFQERSPEPSDLIIPNKDGGPRNVRRSLKSFHFDLETLGLRKRRHYDTRRTLISLARDDDANKDILHWITHGPRGGDIDDLYTTLSWEALCAQVSKLKVSLPTAPAVTTTVEMSASDGTARDSARDTQDAGNKKAPESVDLGALLLARSTGLEGGHARPTEQGQDGKPSESLDLTSSVSVPRPTETEGTVTLSQALERAHGRWLETGDAKALRRALHAILTTLEDL